MLTVSPVCQPSVIPSFDRGVDLNPGLQLPLKPGLVAIGSQMLRHLVPPSDGSSSPGSAHKFLSVRGSQDPVAALGPALLPVNASVQAEVLTSGKLPQLHYSMVLHQLCD